MRASSLPWPLMSLKRGSSSNSHMAMKSRMSRRGARDVRVGDEPVSGIEVQACARHVERALSRLTVRFEEVHLERPEADLGAVDVPDREAAEDEPLDGEVAGEQRIARLPRELGVDLRLARHLDVDERAHVGKVEPRALVDGDQHLVVEADGDDRGDHQAVPERDVRVVDLECVRPEADARVHRGCRNADHVAARRVAVGAVEDLEVARVAHQVAVDMHRPEGAADMLEDALLQMPLHDGIGRDLEVAHHRFELQVLAHRPGRRDGDALGERFDEAVEERDLAVAEAHVEPGYPHLVVVDVE